MWNIVKRVVLCIVLMGSVSVRGQGTDLALGTWHGELTVPTGKLTLIVRIETDENGHIAGSLESPDQAPGQLIDLDSIELDGTHLSFQVPKIGASWEGDWIEADQNWVGTFTQGMKLPLVLKRGLAAPRPTVDGLDGTWKGIYKHNGVQLRLVVHIHTGTRGTVATLDSPDQLSKGIAVSGLMHQNDTVRFDIPVANVHYEGRLTAPDTLEGTWTQLGKTTPITFERVDEDQANEQQPRPQNPTKPYGYVVEEVTFANPQAAGITLAGTLTMPEGDGPFPAAVLITGSGPQDRDESLLGHKPFWVLADFLTKHGIAVLRYDDRGVGKSTGTFSSATSADFATDANAAIDYLRTRSEINPDAIGFIGHSEGGVVAPLAASIRKNDHIAYIVFLAGPGTPMVDLLLDQTQRLGRLQGASEEDLAELKPVLHSILQAAATAPDQSTAQAQIEALLTPEKLEALGIPESQKTFTIEQYTSDWMRYLLAYDPKPYLESLTMPILALNGSLDMQVPAEANLAGLKAGLAHNPDVTIMELPGLNHLFQHATTGAMGEYQDIEETFAPQAMEIISDWINARFGSNE